MKKSIVNLSRMFLLSASLLMLVPFSSAALVFDTVGAVHNVGDDFTVKLTVTRGSTVYDFLIVQLVCPAGSMEIYKTPLQVIAGEQKSVSVPARLDRFFLNGLQGTCTLRANYAQEEVQSHPFEISSEVFLRLSSNALTILPGATLTLTGTATKKNGDALEGLANILVENINLSSSTLVQAGSFNVSFVLPLNMKAGTYQVRVDAGDYDATGFPLNAGSAYAPFSVPHVPTALDIAVMNSEQLPGSNITYTVMVYDQAEESLTTDVSVTLADASGKNLATVSGSSGATQTFALAQNATPGVWTLEAHHAALQLTKSLYVLPVKNVSFSIVNDTLTVINIGNVPYQQTIELTIGDEQRPLELDLAVGESKRWLLSAPDGSYVLSVNSGEQTLPLGPTFLTGNAIEVRENTGLLGSALVWIWWFFLILIAAAVAVYAYRKISLRTFWGRMPGAPESVSVKNTAPRMVASSESTPSGGKQMCAVVAVALKNFSQLEHAHDHGSLDAIAKLSTLAARSEARVYHQGGYRVAIFPPTAGENPALKAVAFARAVESTLADHNRRHALKIEFGIGINKGLMIVEQFSGSPKFTSVGTTVLAAKKIAEQSQAQVLLSEEAHHGLTGKIKAAKINDKHWRLQGVVQRGAHSDFIKRFSERQRFS